MRVLWPRFDFDRRWSAAESEGDPELFSQFEDEVHWDYGWAEDRVF